MIVADTSVLASLFIQTAQTEECQRLLQFDQDWRAPSLWRFEFANVVLKHHLAGGLSLNASHQALRASSEFNMIKDSPIGLEAVLTTAIRHKLSAYDAQFLTLAQALGVSCASYDKALIRSAPTQVFSPSQILSKEIIDKRE